MNKTTVEQVLQRDGRYIVTPVGISMRPMLRSRTDTVLVVSVTRDLRRGDVVLYRRPDGKMVLHRICRVKKNQYVLGGDNLPCREHGVRREWICGVMKGFYRGERYVSADGLGYRAYVWAVLLTHPLRAPFMRLREHRRNRKGRS